jgi:hypothetical protein
MELRCNKLRVMRYIDTGKRDPDQSLGAWLASVLLSGPPVTSVRIQTGFFSGAVIGYIEGALSRLQETKGPAHLLIGSNDGVTKRSDLEALLKAAGERRPNLHLAVVSFMNGYFHPKVYLFEREDGTSTAYVGSANFTRQGVSKHIESGLIVDSGQGDDPALLLDIASAIDVWFEEPHEGLFPFSSSEDLEELERRHVIGRPQPVPFPRSLPVLDGEDSSRLESATLYPLVKLPEQESVITESSDILPAERRRWSKILSASDAQRKGRGNQRGSVTLVQGDYRGQIDQSTYFRNELFSDVSWKNVVTLNGKPMERAFIPMRAEVDGVNLGLLTFKVTHEPQREADQNNYTTTLHLDPLSAYFRDHEMTGRRLVITELSDGNYKLVIS